MLNLVWWNNIRMLGMRAMKELLDCKLGARTLLSKKGQQKPEMVKLKRQQKGENIATRYFVLTEVKKIHTEH